MLASSWCIRQALCAAKHPGVLHLAPAGDVDQFVARRGHPRHGAWYDLDGLGVGGEGVDAVVRVGVAKEEVSLFRLAEDVGREVYRLLGHVLHRGFFDLPAELPDRLLGLLRSDHDLLAPVATPALDDQLIEVVHNVAPLLLYRERPGPGVLYEGLLSEVAAHHLGDEGADTLVVYYLRMGGEEHVYFPLHVRLEQPWHLGVERILVDALVDHIHPASGRCED